jgi:hypothetical protein
MTTLAAGSAAALTLPAGAALTISGLGTYQLMPPGTNGNFSPKVWHQVGAQPQVLGPLATATVVNIAAAAGGPGLKYALSSSTPAVDTVTQEIVTVSRALTQADNGTVIPVANGITLTAAAGTLVAFSCIVMPVTGATASIAFSGGATGNGAGTTITRTRTANIAGFSILQDVATGADAFAVGGA